jgi:hypothetical protein
MEGSMEGTFLKGECFCQRADEQALARTGFSVPPVDSFSVCGSYSLWKSRTSAADGVMPLPNAKSFSGIDAGWWSEESNQRAVT